MTAGSNNIRSIDPGKTRGMQRVTSADGYFITCALDHGDDYRELIDPDLTKVPYARTVSSKLDLISALQPYVSSFLLDPEYAAAQSILTGVLSRGVGLMVCVEAEGGYAGTGERGQTRFRDGWNAAKIKKMGADVCKLLWYFRPDGPIQETQCRIVSDLVADCAAQSLPLVVEPIWNALPGEDPSQASWQNRRADGIVESAMIAGELGADLLKLEFPGPVSTPEEQRAAAARCEQISAAVQVPWVILSAGVSYEAFKVQLELACRAGASGFVAGRSIWRDAVPDGSAEPDAEGLERARSRLTELADITVRYGTPHKPTIAKGAVSDALEKYWYRDWR